MSLNNGSASRDKHTNSNRQLDFGREEAATSGSDNESPHLSESGKKINKHLLRKASDSDFQYYCEWQDCQEVTHTMNEFNHHVTKHLQSHRQYLCSITQQDTGGFCFACPWRECNATIEGQMDDFSRHVFYHTFHQYLKFLGHHIQTVEKLNSCTLDTSSRNVIPELPEKLMCRWPDCGLVYDNPYIFYSHVSHHCEDYPKGSKAKIKCYWEGCEITKNLWYQMKEHMRSHTQAKVVACPTCGSLFANNTRFIDHLKRQGDVKDKKFECSHCSSRFPSERILRDHMRHHVNNYKCPLCNMTCHSPSSVRDHVRYRHSDERNYQCGSCDYRGKTQTDLCRHLATHDDKGPFACKREGCEMVFISLPELRKHYKTHEEGSKQQYECHVCKKCFCRGAYLTNHLMDMHNYRWPSGHKKFSYGMERHYKKTNYQRLMEPKDKITAACQGVHEESSSHEQECSIRETCVVIYKLYDDGIRRLQTVRYESIEVSQQVLSQDLDAQHAKSSPEAEGAESGHSVIPNITYITPALPSHHQNPSKNKKCIEKAKSLKSKAPKRKGEANELGKRSLRPKKRKTDAQSFCPLDVTRGSECVNTSIEVNSSITEFQCGGQISYVSSITEGAASAHSEHLDADGHDKPEHQQTAPTDSHTASCAETSGISAPAGIYSTSPCQPQVQSWPVTIDPHPAEPDNRSRVKPSVSATSSANVTQQAWSLFPDFTTLKFNPSVQVSLESSNSVPVTPVTYENEAGIRNVTSGTGVAHLTDLNQNVEEGPQSTQIWSENAATGSDTDIQQLSPARSSCESSVTILQPAWALTSHTSPSKLDSSTHSNAASSCSTLGAPVRPTNSANSFGWAPDIDNKSNELYNLEMLGEVAVNIQEVTREEK